MRRRRPVDHRGPGLARTVARTAVISATATAASGAVADRQSRRHRATGEAASDARGLADMQRQVEELQAREVQEDLTPGEAEDLVSQLEKLGELHQKGLLTAEEFGAAKAKLLGA